MEIQTNIHFLFHDIQGQESGEPILGSVDEIRKNYIRSENSIVIGIWYKIFSNQFTGYTIITINIANGIS